MTGDIDRSIMRLWESTSSLSVEVLSVEWESFSEFNDSFLKVARDITEIALLLEVAKSCWRIRRTLLSTPLRPSYFADIFRQISSDCLHFADVAAEHSASHMIAALEQSCASLAESENPLVIELENISSRFDRTGLLLSEEALRPAVQNLLDDFELDGISVLSAKQLRNFDAPPLDSLICVGNPQQSFRRSIATSRADSQRSGWLFTSPPAPKTFMVATSLSKPVAVNDLWLLDGSRPAIEIIANGDISSSPFEAEITEPDKVEISNIPWSVAVVEHRVMCVKVAFQSGRLAFFSESKLGSPRVIDIDERGRVAIIRVPALNLAPGMVILLQGSRSETEEIRERAVQMLRLLGDKEKEIHEVLELVSQVKRKMSEVLDTYGKEWFESRLTESGLGTGYSRYLISAPLHPEYIAPTKGFNQFLTAIGLEESIKMKPSIERYRSACRRAGQRMDRGLLRDLESDTEWEDRLDSGGATTIARRESGTLLVERVMRIGESVEVPVSQIGKMIGVAK
jgi:hypothetical protein